MRPNRLIYPIILLAVLATLTQGLFGQKKALEIDIAKKWSYPLAGQPTAIAHYGDEIFVASGSDRIEAVSLEGKKIWSAEFGGSINSDLLATESGLFFTNTVIPSGATKPGGSKLRSVSRDTGITNWTVQIPDADGHFLGGFNGSVIVVSSSGSIQSVDAKTGAVRWQRQIAKAFAAQPSFSTTSLTVATAGKQIFTISLANGEILSMRKVPYEVTALTASNGAVAVGDARGNLAYYKNGSDKADWTFKSGGAILQIYLTGGDALVSSYDNFVYFIAGKSGSRLWKRRLSGRVPMIANVADRFGLVASEGDARAEFIDLSTGKIAGQILVGEDEHRVSRPITYTNGNVFVLTTSAVHAVSSKSFIKK